MRERRRPFLSLYKCSSAFLNKPRLPTDAVISRMESLLARFICRFEVMDKKRSRLRDSAGKTWLIMIAVVLLVTVVSGRRRKTGKAKRAQWAVGRLWMIGATLGSEEESYLCIS